MDAANSPRAFDRAGERSASLAAAAGLLGAVAASSCCILPLALFALGVSGAWIGNLTALEPYQPVFVAITLGGLAAGYRLAYRKPAAVCAEGAACSRPLSRRIVRSALWLATALVVAAVAFPYIARLLLRA